MSIRCLHFFVISISAWEIKNIRPEIAEIKRTGGGGASISFLLTIGDWMSCYGLAHCQAREINF